MIMPKRKTTTITETTLRRIIRSELLREVFGLFESETDATAGQWNPNNIIKGGSAEEKKQLLISMASIAGLIDAPQGNYVEKLEKYASSLDDEEFNKLADAVLVAADTAMAPYDARSKWDTISEKLIKAGSSGVDIDIETYFEELDFYKDDEPADLVTVLDGYIDKGLMTCEQPGDIYMGCKITPLGLALTKMKDKLRVMKMTALTRRFSKQSTRFGK